jgi:hypothetical protein
VLKVETYGGGIVVPEGAREKYARTFRSFLINQQEITCYVISGLGGCQEELRNSVKNSMLIPERKYQRGQQPIIGGQQIGNREKKYRRFTEIKPSLDA